MLPTVLNTQPLLNTDTLARAGKNLGFLLIKLVFKVLTYKCRTQITTHKQRFGHVNATNRNSYLNIICIKISYTSFKKLKTN